MNFPTPVPFFRKLLAVLSCVFYLVASASAQEAPLLKNVKTIWDGAIQLYWQSESNAVYRIEYATELLDSSTSWNVLYDDYPSHGTNTFWMDNGDYTQTPAIPPPRYKPMRFYRIANKGTNSGLIPFVSITSPTNGSVLSGQITVSVIATSSYPNVTMSLFVDGEEMDSSDDGTNYVINTCEWENGDHVLFATARAQSTLSGPSGSFSTDIGRAVTAYRSVTFDNLIHQIAFSEPFFEPSLGQTQKVTAAFAANVDWTLQILDESSNAVRTVTGSGSKLAFNWNGTGDGGTNIPDGVYMYLITAETNGLPAESGEEFGGGGGDPPSPGSNSSINSEFNSDFLEILLPPLPEGLSYGLDEKGNEITSMMVERSSRNLTTQSSTFLESLESGNAFTSSFSSRSQSALAPTRPPTKPIKNAIGTVGIAYYEWVGGANKNVPANGLGLLGNSGKVQIQGSYNAVHFDALPESRALATKFANKMAKGGYKLSFNKSGTNLLARELKKSSLGGSNLFAGVNIGYFSDHGSFGTSLDWHNYASQSQQTYFPSDNPADSSNPWIALSEFGFGGTNLLWMAIDACNSLHDDQYQSMKNKGVLPLGSSNHLLCGSTTETYSSEKLGELWAKKMIGTFLTAPNTVKESWFIAGHDAYKWYTGITNNIYFRVAGWDNCFTDKLKNYEASPSQDLTSEDRKVYAP